MSIRTPSLLASLVVAFSVPAAHAQPVSGDAERRAISATPPAVVAEPPSAVRAPARVADVARERAQIEELFRSFEAEAREYRDDVQLIIERRFEDQKEALVGRYERAIREKELGERQERLAAIELFERFIAKYPDDPKYTPDAMIRLAELYYEKAVDDQQLALAAFEERQRMGSLDEPPQDAVRSFDRSIALYRRVIEKFPDYRLIDTVHYLLGWCLGEQGEAELARDTFRALIERHPDSRHVPEAWVRIGEYYFDAAGDDEGLREAIHAYQKAIAFRDSALYDKALYKLGWSYYRLNEFDPAVETFLRLIDHYGSLSEQDPDGGDLRGEALQYTAISFADESWGGVQRMVEFFKALGGRRYEHELFRRLGDVLFDSTRYKEAIEAYRIVLARAPTSADAPQVQDRIVQAYARDGDRDAAFAERSRLVDLYGAGTPWHEANKGDQNVLSAARELVEKSMLASAQFFHLQAADYEKQANDETLSLETRQQAPLLAFKNYQQAAKAYGDYLKEYPHTRDLYDIQYFHAETLYRSLQFRAAAEVYAKVRDSNTDNKYLANAAYNVVLSLQREIEQQESQGLLERREPCSTDCKARLAEFKPLMIPDVRRELIQAADVYMKKVPEAEDAPLLSYRAAQTFFAFFHFDEARERYEEIIRRYGDSEYSEYAYNDIFISYLLVDDWMNVETFADRLLAESRRVRDDPERRSEVRTLKYGARFKRADLAMQAQKWDEAARLYVSIVDDTQKEAKEWGAFTDADKALYNAATCYREGRRFASAMDAYERLYKEFPKSPLAETALFFVAENAEKAFEFDRAIDGYRRLVDGYRDSRDRAAAMFNLAQLYEATQQYDKAAKAFQDYADQYPNEADAPDMAFKAATISQRTRDFRTLIDGLQRFVRKYGARPEHSEKIVQAWARIGHAHRELGNDAEAYKAWERTVGEYDRLKQQPETFAAQAAGDAALQLAERAFKQFEKAKFDPRGRGARLQKSIQTQLEGLAGQLEDVKRRYTEVIVKYRWPEWQTAALFRMGNADEIFAQKLIDSPCPAEIRNELGEEGCTEYRIMLEEQMAPIHERAVNAYVTAADKAQELRIVNEWTKLTMEKVCQTMPSNCRSLKEARAELLFDAHSPRPLVATADGATGVQVAGMLVQSSPPVILDVQPRRIAAGETIVVTGEHFSLDVARNGAALGSTGLVVRRVGERELQLTIPATAASAPLTITTPGGSTTTPFVIEILPAAMPGIGSPASIQPIEAQVPATPAPVAGASEGGAP